MSIKKIHNQEYVVEELEFMLISSPEYHPLLLREDVSQFDREIAFLKELSKTGDLQFIDLNTSHGGYIPINLHGYYNQITIIPGSANHQQNIHQNTEKKKNERGAVFNVLYHNSSLSSFPNITTHTVLRVNKGTRYEDIREEMKVEMEGEIKGEDSYDYIICDDVVSTPDHHQLSFNGRCVYVRKGEVWNKFLHRFRDCVDEEYHTLTYDNLIHLLVMVKNGGEDFRQMLRHNLPLVDAWTILDTGSTDNTINIIREETSSPSGSTALRRGKLFQEPFINFRDSRNRLFDLAGTDYAFNVMLDDTYYLRGDLRKFLTVVRSDDVAESYSLFIRDIDMMYGGGRVTKPSLGLRYRYTIHEIIESNYSVYVPLEHAFIEDKHSKYMKERTTTRKKNDIYLLEQEIKENPDDPRNYYYMAETYLCMEDWKNAAVWYEKRKEMDGYREEKSDSYYKFAVMHDLYLNTPWRECIGMYLDAYHFDPTRPEYLFMIGYHYDKKNNQKNRKEGEESDDLAYMYYQEAFNIGVPTSNIGMNIRTELYNIHLPSALCVLAYKRRNYNLLHLCAKRWYDYCVKVGRDDKMAKIGKGWMSISTLIQKSLGSVSHADEMQSTVTHMLLKKKWRNDVGPHRDLRAPSEALGPSEGDKKLITFVIDGGWNEWDGETLRTTGLGGSETSVIRYAETIVKNYSDEFHVIVFCKCKAERVFNGVLYKKIIEYPTFIREYHVYFSLINRYTEYVPVTTSSEVDCYLILHDLCREEDIIVKERRLKGVLCLSEWHKTHVNTLFPELKDITGVFSYGLDIDQFEITADETLPTIGGSGGDITPQLSTVWEKEPYTFIYPSFPNRGLYWLLKLFPRITQRYPAAKLHVFCDTTLDWLHSFASDEMKEIDKMITEQNNVINHGWVSKEELIKYWAVSRIWLYTCNFYETCCLVGYEAAASLTLAIGTELGALINTISDRGILIPGTPSEERWRDEAFRIVCEVLDGKRDVEDLLQKNYDWVCEQDFDIVVEKFVEERLR